MLSVLLSMVVEGIRGGAHHAVRVPMPNWYITWLYEPSPGAPAEPPFLNFSQSL